VIEHVSDRRSEVGIGLAEFFIKFVDSTSKRAAFLTFLLQDFKKTALGSCVAEFVFRFNQVFQELGGNFLMVQVRQSRVKTSEFFTFFRPAFRSRKYNARMVFRAAPALR
jgi:hypothetical protein